MQLMYNRKLQILKADKSNLLNRRSELISRYRNENKFYFINFHNDNYLLENLTCHPLVCLDAPHSFIYMQDTEY